MEKDLKTLNESGSKMPITLVLPSYNKADVIVPVIESIAKGSMQPDLIVMSDDGSSDNTPELAQSTAKQFGIPCYVINHLRTNSYRLQTMRNSGISNALDGLIIMSDSDCIFGKHTIESHYEIHKKYDLAIGTGPRFEFLEGTSGPFTSMYATLEYAHYPDGNYLVPYGANCSFLKTLWKRLGGFSRAYEGFYGLDDHEFYIRAEKLGAVCFSDPEAYVFHCPHETLLGERSQERNTTIFKNSFGVDWIADTHEYHSKHVIPWYQDGNRKQSLLGNKASLDDWGAPHGFQPPPHLVISLSLDPLLERVRKYLASGSNTDLDNISSFTGKIYKSYLLENSPEHFLIDKINSLLEDTIDKQKLKSKLLDWCKNAGKSKL